MPESLGEEGPHDGIAGEQQASAQQPQRDVELQAGETGKQQSEQSEVMRTASVLLVKDFLLSSTGRMKSILSFIW